MGKRKRVSEPYPVKSDGFCSKLYPVPKGRSDSRDRPITEKRRRVVQADGCRKIGWGGHSELMGTGQVSGAGVVA